VVEPLEGVPAPATRSRIDGLEEYLLDDLTEAGSLLTLKRDLKAIVDQYQPFGIRPAMVLVDIDNFRRINSVFGRTTGDQVLVTTAARLRKAVPPDDVIYRTGGDEFVALLGSIPMIDAVAWAEQIQKELSLPVRPGPSTVSISVSVAVVMLGHRHRVDGLLRDADVAMYRAKAEGGNRVDVYNWESDSWTMARKRDTARLEKEVEELRLQNRALSDAITLDLDTGIPNALAFEADHVQADAWRKRSGESYAILLASVDGLDDGRYFRSPAGDKALTFVANAIRDTVRQADRAYVLDKGEYAVLLRGSTIKQAIAAAGRIRSGVESLDAEDPADPGRKVSVSIAAIEAGFRHPGPEDVLEEVNDLLRRAVGTGPGQILWPH
jgi:diguanylate cyclase (GGDEF)-like protein